MPEDELDNTELAAACATPAPQLGEMLYPGFNTIIP